MSPAQQIDMIGQSVIPRLSEAGVEAFVLVGYILTESGELKRICLAHTGQNPAYRDGLRPVVQFANVWGHDDPTPPHSPPTESSGLAPQ